MKSNSKIPNFIRALTGSVSDPFDREVAGLGEASSTETVRLNTDSIFEMRAAPARKRIGDKTLRLLAYNGSVPGPTLVVPQGSEVFVKLINEMELDTTVHWHGLRLENRFDGVPRGEHSGMQPPGRPGGSFTYRLRFPDPGVFWYHPHIREDYTQEHGLYGNIVVVPNDPAYLAPVNRELTLVIDDILIARGKVAPFSQSGPNRIAMGRFGNTMLVNGEAFYQLSAQRGEVVRIYVTNTANVRIFNLRIPGARMKWLGSDNGRVEREAFVDQVMISPSERVVLDVLFEQEGDFPLEHRTPLKTYPLGEVNVSPLPVDNDFLRQFYTLRQSEELQQERAGIESDFVRHPDKTIALIGEMPGMKHGGGHHGKLEEIEWEDTMALHNRMTTPENMIWKIVERETGAANHDINWVFKVGERVKIRIINEPHSDHPMQHPFHFHGERFLVLSQNGVLNDNLAWKDTVLVRAGETVDILLDCTNPGLWMAHCHIAEHVEGGMMFNFLVDGEQSEEQEQGPPRTFSQGHHKHE
jgi:FtsP/CotA-like multicopper oxidase with cupredoxin domain